MSAFQERIFAASVSPYGNSGNDPEQYRYRTSTSEEYLAACDYRVWSTELPEQFLIWWICPCGTFAQRAAGDYGWESSGSFNSKIKRRNSPSRLHVSNGYTFLGGYPIGAKNSSKEIL